MVHPDVSAKKPLYVRKDFGQRHQIWGLDNNRIKFDKSICVDCNSARTQPHDKAWDALVTVVRGRATAEHAFLQPLSAVYGASWQEETINAQLYVAKLLGCMLCQFGESSSPVPLATLAKAIIEGYACPDLYVAFGTYHGDSTRTLEDVPLVVAHRIDSAALRFVHAWNRYDRLVVGIYWSPECKRLLPRHRWDAAGHNPYVEIQPVRWDAVVADLKANAARPFVWNVAGA